MTNLQSHVLCSLGCKTQEFARADLKNLPPRARAVCKTLPNRCTYSELLRQCFALGNVATVELLLSGPEGRQQCQCAAWDFAWLEVGPGLRLVSGGAPRRATTPCAKEEDACSFGIQNGI